MADENKSIKQKIAKLLSKADATVHAEEQDAFMRKVNELLERHQISLHEVRETGTDNDPMTSVEGYISRTHEWPSRVGFALAKYYGGEMLRWQLRNTKARYKYVVIGRESVCTTFELMFPFILSQTLKQSRAYARDYGITQAKAERHVGIALAMRIRDLTPAAEQRRSELTANALVPVSDVAAYIEQLFGKVKTVRKVQGIDYSAMEYAEKVSLHRHVTEQPQLKIGNK